jgi:hypothetical protein
VLHLDRPDDIDDENWLLDDRYAWMLEPTGDTEAVLGRAGRSFKQWVRDHAEDFEPTTPNLQRGQRT